MLSYQHTYHAGNHADIVKHIVLQQIVLSMQNKDTPMFMLDAFASRAIYDLTSPEAQKNSEFKTGAELLWQQFNAPSQPAPIRTFLQHLQAHNEHGKLHHYPGSSSVLLHHMREQDQLMACDLHPQEFDALSQLSHRNTQKVSTQQRDAYEALKALLPPKQKRGIVFLDPSYEDKSEYRRIAEAVIARYPHFRAGVYIIWYPLLPAGNHAELLKLFKHSGIRKILRVELDTADHESMQMHGSGLLIINPPWQAQSNIQLALNWLQPVLAPKGFSHFDWLVDE